MPLAQIKELDAGGRFDPRFAGERVPTLAEVFAEVGQQLLINVELKAQPPHVRGLEQAVVDLINRMGLASRVWFSSFKPYMLSEVRRLAPQIPCGLLYDPSSIGVFLLALVTPYEALHPHYTLAEAARVRRAHRRGLRMMAWTVDDVTVARHLAAAGVDGLITNAPDRLLAAMG
jgi:glycerophosphoryl diester phosphodiesterase